jgi:hypothetical protein
MIISNNELPKRNSQKQQVIIHLKKEELTKLDEYVNIQNITTRKKFIEFLVINFIKNLK